VPGGKQQRLHYEVGRHCGLTEDGSADGDWRNIFRFSFKREAHWLLAVCVIVPWLAILFGIGLPALWRRWFP
jgi:hypothetical protein